MTEDWRTAPVSDRVKAVLGFLEKFVPLGSDFGAEDIEALRKAGLEDGAIKEALYVSFCFQNLSRWADAFDWPLPTEKGLAMAGKILWKRGYATGSIGPWRLASQRRRDSLRSQRPGTTAGSRAG